MSSELPDIQKKDEVTKEDERKLKSWIQRSAYSLIYDKLIVLQKEVQERVFLFLIGTLFNDAKAKLDKILNTVPIYEDPKRHAIITLKVLINYLDNTDFSDYPGMEDIVINSPFEYKGEDLA